MDALVCPLCRIALTAVGEDVPSDVCPRDGRPGVAVAWLPVPAGLAQRFQVLGPFAHGDGGSLYLADEPETGRRGLLKILAPAGKDQLAERQRLRRELVKQSTLARSHLVVPLANGETDGVTWLFREWLDGVSLEVRLSREGNLPQTEALAIAAQIASALDELHRGGLLHRDVKPGHVFLQPSPNGIPRALLLDAGVVSPLHERSDVIHHSGTMEHAVENALAAREGRGHVILDSNGHSVLGTAGYIAPEQLLGKLISFRSDLYSLGCTLYRMLTGRPAFSGETVTSTLSAQRYGELPPLPSDLPNGIGALLRSILSKDPQQRPFSAQKLRRTLDPYLPDGALMEKQQSTSTYEAVPEGTPNASIPPPSGTLRPPAPPRSSSQPPSPVVRGAAPPAPPRSLPPPAPATRPREERTQQIDIGQIEEVRQMEKKRTTSVPPPTPQSVQKLTDKTQPIRLDQILAVTESRKAATNPPPARKEEAPLLTPPAAQRSVPARATAHGMAPPPKPVETVPFEAQAEKPAEASQEMFARTAPGIAGLQKPEPAAEVTGTPLFSQLDEPLSHPPATAMFEPPAQAPARPPMKATLMGMGEREQNSVDLTLERAKPAQALSTRPVAQTEREHPTERLALNDAGFDDEEDRIAPGLFDTVRTRFLSDRRGMMYAGAAVVGLGVLTVAASALFSSDPTPVANRAQDPVVTAAPAAVAVAPVPTSAPVAPQPTVEQIRTPTVESTAPAVVAAAPGTPRVQPMAEPKPHEEPKAERAERHHEHHTREVVAAAPAKSKRAEPAAPKENHKSAKSASTEKASGKEAQFAAARDEARNAYSAKNYKAAAAAYEKASKLDPKHAGTFAGLGAARLQLGENKAAVAAYQRAVQLSPDTSGFHAALGRAYLAVGDRNKAVSAYKKAMQLDPKNEAAKAALAQIGG